MMTVNGVNTVNSFAGVSNANETDFSIRVDMLMVFVAAIFVYHLVASIFPDFV